MTEPHNHVSAASGNDLKPCPFCGSEPDIGKRMDEDLSTHNIVEWTGVSCAECGISFEWPPSVEPDAVTQWNTRVVITTDAQAEQERIAELQYEAGMYQSLYENAIERCAIIAEGFDAACDSPRMKLFVEAGLVMAIYKRDGEIGAAIRALASQPSPAATVETTAPGHTDLMVTPESIDAFLEANPPHHECLSAGSGPVAYRHKFQEWQDWNYSSSDPHDAEQIVEPLYGALPQEALKPGKLTEDQIMQVIRKVTTGDLRKMLTCTRWKDGIDIDQPTYAAERLAEEFRAATAVTRPDRQGGEG